MRFKLWHSLILISALMISCFVTAQDGEKPEAEPSKTGDFSLAPDAAYNNLLQDLEKIKTNVHGKIEESEGVLGSGLIPRIELVVDSSGSMGQMLTLDKSRMYYMKKILTRYLIDQYQVKAETGLRVYGAKKKGDCSDDELLVKFGEKSLPKIELSVAKLTPLGRTPLFKAVQNAALDLKSYPGPKAIIVFTDLAPKYSMIAMLRLHSAW